ALLALLLLLEELALSADVAAVALRQHVLADGADRLAGDDARSDRRLDRNLVLLSRNELAKALGHRRAVRVRLVAVHDGAERVDAVALQQDVDLDEVGLLGSGGLVVEARIPLRAALELVKEIEDDLAERHRVL